MSYKNEYGLSDDYIELSASDNSPSRVERLNRVVGFCCALSDNLLGNLLKLCDWKGCLQVTWIAKPTAHDIKILESAWTSAIATECSENISHEVAPMPEVMRIVNAQKAAKEPELGPGECLDTLESAIERFRGFCNKTISVGDEVAKRLAYRSRAELEYIEFSFKRLREIECPNVDDVLAGIS